MLIVRLKAHGDLHRDGFLTLVGRIENAPSVLEPRIRKSVAWYEAQLRKAITNATGSKTDRGGAQHP